MVHQKLSGASRPKSYDDPKNSSFSGFSDTGLHQDLQVTLVQAHLQHVHDAQKPAIAQWPIDSLFLCCLIYVINLIFDCGLLSIHWNTPLPFTGLSQPQLAATPNKANTQHAVQSHQTFKSRDGFQQLWRPFSHNSFEGTPALRRSSRRKSFGWNAAEKTFICLLEDTT